MQMGRFGWQQWPWQSWGAAGCWALHKEQLQAQCKGTVWEVTGKPTALAVWFLVLQGGEGSQRGQWSFRRLWEDIGVDFKVLSLSKGCETVCYGHVLMETCALRMSTSSQLWSWISTENSWGIFTSLQSASKVMLQICSVLKQNVLSRSILLSWCDHWGKTIILGWHSEDCPLLWIKDAYTQPSSSKYIVALWHCLNFCFLNSVFMNSSSLHYLLQCLWFIK